MIKPIKKGLINFFRIYIKTFGGKIWTNLHRVSPGNNFGKNFNKPSFWISRQKIIKQHLVQNEIEANANLSSLGKNQNSLENSVPFLSFFFNFDSMMSSLDFFLTAILCTRCVEDVNEETSWQAIESLIRSSKN